MIKRFWMIEKNIFIISYVITIYTLIAIGYFVSDLIIEYISARMEIFIIFSLTIIISFVVSLIDYIKRKEVAKGICYQVLEKCAIRDQYERFLAIKKCIETYKRHGKCNIRRNIYVIEASIERDQAYTVVFPLIITIVTALFIEKEIISILSPVSLMLFSFLVLSVKEIITIIPRNAFIKKVVECIRKENNL